MGITSTPWGQTPDGEAFLYSLEQGEMRLSVASYGGLVTSLMVPGRSGAPGEITLGYANLAGYLADQCYMGRLVGRVANRTSKARFELDGKQYELDRNHGHHQLHGGTRGFHSRLWKVEPGACGGDPCLRLSLVSENGDQGYPGRMQVSVTYTLTASALRIAYEAETDAPSPVNLTSHIYFNLAGPRAQDCLAHGLAVAASNVQETDAELIPTGRLLPVAGTVLDFSRSKPMGRDLDLAHPLLAVAKGYDHSFVLNGEAGPAAILTENGSGLRMEMHTDFPCVQVYTGNHIPTGLAGRRGEVYRPRQGVCLEAQEYVDGVNRPEFPASILRPGQRYERTVQYSFS